MKRPAVHTLISPRITEKGAYLSAKGVYVFNVGVDANKVQIAEAIREVFKVTPRKVTIVSVPRKAVRTRNTNQVGYSRGGKKAYVYLKAGDTIEIA